MLCGKKAHLTTGLSFAAPDQRCLLISNSVGSDCPSPRDRSAPAGQVISILALGKLKRLSQRSVKVRLDDLAFHPPAQEIGPQKFAERRRVLGEAADAPQFAGK